MHTRTHFLSRAGARAELVSSAIMTHYATLALTALTSALGLGVVGRTPKSRLCRNVRAFESKKILKLLFV